MGVNYVLQAERTQEGSNDFWCELGGNIFENTLKVQGKGSKFSMEGGQRSVRLPWIAKVWLEKPTVPKRKVETIFTQLRKRSKDLIKSWCLLNQNGQSTTKVDSMKPCLMKKVFALQCHEALPSGGPYKWTFNLWWWRGLLWGCLNPLRGGKVEAGKQGNKYFPTEKA